MKSAPEHQIWVLFSHKMGSTTPRYHNFLNKNRAYQITISPTRCFWMFASCRFPLNNLYLLHCHCGFPRVIISTKDRFLCLFICLSPITSKGMHRSLKNIYVVSASPKEEMIKFEKDAYHFWKQKKNSRTFKAPIFNVFSMTLALWLTLVQN